MDASFSGPPAIGFSIAFLGLGLVEVGDGFEQESVLDDEYVVKVFKVFSRFEKGKTFDAVEVLIVGLARSLKVEYPRVIIQDLVGDTVVLLEQGIFIIIEIYIY